MEYRISQLIYKSLSGELSENEQKEFDAWISLSDNKAHYQKIIESKSINDKVDLYESFDSQKAYSKLNSKLVTKGNTRTLSLQRFIRYAAVITLIVGLGYTAYNFTQDSKVVLVKTDAIEKSNPNGRKSTFELPDGTIVNLNSASKMRYIDDEMNKLRIVELEGEAYFDVAKNAYKPFVVRSGSIATKAIGTSFNVKSYPNENEFKVILTSGKVEVSQNSNSDKVYLTPGFGVAYNTKTKDLVKYNYDEEMELAWKNSILYFDESNIDEVIKLLERWYGVSITIENKDRIKQWKYSSKFENETLENVLNGISYIQEFDFDIDDKKVTLKF